MMTCQSNSSLDHTVALFEDAAWRSHRADPLIGPEVESRAQRHRATVLPGGVRRVPAEPLLRGRYRVGVEDPHAADRRLRAATDAFVERLTAHALDHDAPPARRHKALINLVANAQDVFLADGCYRLAEDSYQLDLAPPAVEAFFQRGCMGEWYRDTVARVHALEALYQPFGRLMNPDRTPIDPVASAIFRYTADGRGVRSRGAIAEHLICRAAMASLSRSFRVVSLACGAARPVLHARCEAGRAGRHVEVELRDLDPAALAFARVIAGDLGIDSDDLTCGDVDLRRPETFAQIEPADMIEALGIVEYFPQRIAAAFLSQAMARVKPGGVLLFGNMLPTHPQLEFNRRVVSWPGLFPRSITDMTRLAGRCGVAPEQVEVYQAEDGVYAVYVWHKPE